MARMTTALPPSVPSEWLESCQPPSGRGPRQAAPPHRQTHQADYPPPGQPGGLRSVNASLHERRTAHWWTLLAVESSRLRSARVYLIEIAGNPLLNFWVRACAKTRTRHCCYDGLTAVRSK